MFGAIWTRCSIVCAALLGGAGVEAASCERVVFEDLAHSVCWVDPSENDVRLFYRDARDNSLVGSFARLENLLKDDGKDLLVAMNAGMYHPDRRPVGLLIRDGIEIASIQLRDGPGNFGLLPNGVLCLSDRTAQIVESRTFESRTPDCRDATQSGPMLVIDGKLHPRFLPDSDSLFVRNGAGVRDDGTLVLAISDTPVNFHHFGRLFRDVLDTPNALYLDGNVSKIFAPILGRRDIGLPMGPMIGVVASQD